MFVSAKIAEENGNPFHSGLPSHAWIRSFRAHHKELSFRAFQPKDIAKADAEHPNHVKMYQKAFQNIENVHSDIFKSANLFYNSDKVNVRKAWGEKEKVLEASGKNRCVQPEKLGTDMHVTVLLTANVDFAVLPLQFFIEGRQQMKRWFDPLDKSVVKHSSRLECLTNPGWLPIEASVMMTDNG